jgi:PP-loop superfamily ATP-utilizing enzyme
MPRALEKRGEIVTLGRSCGFTYIAIDLAGYRTGAMNESVVQLKRR